MDTPSSNTICGFCKHPFGKHFVTFDETTDGCSHISPGGGDQRDYYPESRCKCAGFAMVYRPIRPKIMSQAQLTAAYYDK